MTSFMEFMKYPYHNINMFLQIGDRVIGICDTGAWAELACVPAQFVYPMPSGMSFQDGAALFMNYVPAHIMMFDIGGLKNNQSILVHSAGGGVVGIFYYLRYSPLLTALLSFTVKPA